MHDSWTLESVWSVGSPKCENSETCLSYWIWKQLHVYFTKNRARNCYRKKRKYLGGPGANLKKSSTLKLIIKISFLPSICIHRSIMNHLNFHRKKCACRFPPPPHGKYFVPRFLIFISARIIISTTNSRLSKKSQFNFLLPTCPASFVLCMSTWVNTIRALYIFNFKHLHTCYKRWNIQRQIRQQFFSVT